ncbi:MAG TPA: ATP-binding protein [Myxococcota bacterium]|nr:ATP-binding protein [Myxococcota bacterium]
MKLYQQLIIFVLAATAIPLVVGMFILHNNERQLEDRLLASRRDSAVVLAGVVEREMKEIFGRIRRAMGYLSVEEMSPEELAGWLGILYKQSEDITQVALLNKDGGEIVPGVYLDHPERYPEYAGRKGVSLAEHTLFLAGLPRKKATGVSADSLVLGEARFVGDGLRISFVVPLLLPDGQKRWLIALEMSLERIVRRVVEAGDTRGWVAWMVDDRGRVIAHPDRKTANGLRDMSGHPAVAALGRREQGSFFLRDSLAAYARVPELGWGVIIDQPRSEALAEIRRTRRVTLAWTGISILALVFLGWLFTGRITKNLRLLVAGAEEFSRGNLSARVAVASRDEVGILARTFNHMGEELAASREEIEAWNRELARRVEERTRELDLAHRRLLETSKLAAIGQLGAGVAHEINNPLVGILGNVQLILKKLESSPRELEMLKKIESAAKRCREVTQNLLRFSEQEEDPEHVEVDLDQVLGDAFSLTEQQLREQNINTSWDVIPGVKVTGDHRQLMRVFLSLFSNAKTAMREKGGVLIVRSNKVSAGEVKVMVADTGKGIPPEQLDRIFEPFFTTKDVWTNTGLGLSVAYRVIADHGGRIEVESEPGRGSTFSVFLPVAGENA